eukprot:sb/3475021/
MVSSALSESTIAFSPEMVNISDTEDDDEDDKFILPKTPMWRQNIHREYPKLPYTYRECERNYVALTSCQKKKPPLFLDKFGEIKIVHLFSLLLLVFPSPRSLKIFFSQIKTKQLNSNISPIYPSLELTLL